MKKPYEAVKEYMGRAMAIRTAMTLMEWDQETLAPEEAEELTAGVMGTLSGEYFRIITAPDLWTAIEECRGQKLTGAEAANVREIREELLRIRRIPREDYQTYGALTARSTAIWARARKNRDFEAFAPVLKEIIRYKKRFAALQSEGEGLYDTMLKEYEPGFTSGDLDQFFAVIRQELVPFLRRIMEEGREIPDSFLQGDYPEERQEELARFLAEYVGFDFNRGVLGVSAHPFTTNLHNKDVRITTHYTDRVDSSLFSVIHEAGHGIYEMGIDDGLTLTFAGQGASMAMHESQSRFYENILGRSRAFWKPVYGRLQQLFPDQLQRVEAEDFVNAVNKIQPGLIRTEADELTYSLHVLIRYELERELMEGDLEAEKLPEAWNKKYREYLGITPADPAEGVLQDIHWSQGAFGYFPSYALGSAFGAQIYASMKEELDVDACLERGDLASITEYLKNHIHRYGRQKTSRELLKDMTGWDFDPYYYVNYLKEKYSGIYGLDRTGQSGLSEGCGSVKNRITS